MAAAGLTFALRTAVFWLDNWTIHGVLGGLVVTMTGCLVRIFFLPFFIRCVWINSERQIAVASQYRAISDPTRLFGSNCRVLPTVRWMPVGYASFAVFLITALCLTILKVQSHCPQKSLVRYLVYRANLLYLAGTTLTAVTALFIQIFTRPSSALVLCTGPIATVFIVTLGTRAFRNMMLAAALDTNHAHALNPSLDLDTNAEASATFSDTMSEMRFVRPLPPVVSGSPSTKAPLTLDPRLPTTSPTYSRTADATHPGSGNPPRLNSGI
jgi:hypothetical protein